MPFVMSCDNKKCGKTNEPLLDKVTNEVFCAECGQTMNNVTPFTKNSMRTLGQVKREVKSASVFPVKCGKCQKLETPKMTQSKLHCPKCNDEHTHLQPAYAHAVKQFLTGGAGR